MIRSENGLLDIHHGIIVHQVNCQDRIGAGLSGVLIRRFPQIGEAYHQMFKTHSKEEVFGMWQPVNCGNVIVINLFTQFYYGNAQKTGKVYTDYNKLSHCLRSIRESYPTSDIYAPEFLGCGLAGGDWGKVKDLIESLDINIVGLGQEKEKERDKEEER